MKFEKHKKNRLRIIRSCFWYFGMGLLITGVAVFADACSTPEFTIETVQSLFLSASICIFLGITCLTLGFPI